MQFLTLSEPKRDKKNFKEDISIFPETQKELRISNTN